MKTKTTITDLAEKLRFLMDFDPIDQHKTHTIGELASHPKVSLRTLRFYEQAGLLQPDREGLKRLYSPQDLERLEIIVTLRELEVSLTSIKSLIGLVETGGDEARIASMVDEIFSDLARSNRARIEELEVINRRIDGARDAFSVSVGS
jgi:DNA-binding transcriptional MerR regulator